MLDNLKDPINDFKTMKRFDVWSSHIRMQYNEHITHIILKEYLHEDFLSLC